MGCRHSPVNGAALTATIESMKNEQLVLSHMGNAKSLARQFAAKAPVPDYKESESIALLALVESAARYTGATSNGAHFWGFARPHVFGALVDSVRSRYGRGETPRVMVNLEHKYREETAARDPWSAIDARVTLGLAMPFLSKAEGKFLNGVILLGVATEADAEVIGMTVHRYRWNRRQTLRRIREVLS